MPSKFRTSTSSCLFRLGIILIMATLALALAVNGAEITPGPSTDLTSIRAAINAATEGSEESITVGPNRDFKSIQEAIDAAIDGNVILVSGGIYRENLIVNKRLILFSPGARAVVDAGRDKFGALISADGVYIMGFKFFNASGVGIEINSSNNVIAGNLAMYNANAGMKITGSNNTIVSNGMVSNDGDGLCLSHSRDNIITGNGITDNKDCGIDLGGSSNNNVTGNDLYRNRDNGICLEDSWNNKFAGNHADDNAGRGIILWNSSHCMILGSTVINNNNTGIELNNSSDNSIEENVVMKSYIGIKLLGGFNNSISDNLVKGNTFRGIELNNSIGNKITGNEIVFNPSGGIKLLNSSSYNTIKGNRLAENGDRAIGLDVSSKNIIAGNEMALNAYDDVGLGNGSSENEIGDNYIHDKSAYAKYGRTITVGPSESYRTIQAAIDAAQEGDAIIVSCGNYHERLNIKKKLMLISSGGRSVVDADGGKSAIAIYADGVHLEGFIPVNSSESGIMVVSSNNILKENFAMNNTMYGIELLNGSFNNTLLANYMIYGYCGLSLNDSHNNKIVDCITGFAANPGVRLQNSSGNTILRFVIYNSGDKGIELYNSSNNNLTANVISSNHGVGMALINGSDNNTIAGNQVGAGESICIELINVSRNNITDNKISYGMGGGLNLLRNSSYNNIMRNKLLQNGHDGILLDYSSKNTITGNEVSNSVDSGIKLAKGSRGNEVEGNSFIGNGDDGIGIYCCHNNITCNLVDANGDAGIHLVGPSNNSAVIGNTISNNQVGVYFDGSSDNYASDNYVRSNYVEGFKISNCANNILKNNTAAKNDEGIMVDKCKNSSLICNKVSHNKGEGIQLNDADSNTIAGNNVYKNFGGIHIDASSGNNVTGNNVTANRNGIRLNYYSNSNQVWLNGFTRNQDYNAYDEADRRRANHWDSGIVGNYYSDVSCKDEDKNGICDSSYMISGGEAVDRYPLAATPKDSPHADLIAFVDNAVAYAKANGKDKAIKEFNNNKSTEFIKGEHYIFAVDFNGTTLAHPYRSYFVGRSQMDLNDTNGVALFKNMASVAKRSNGFVYYVFANPAHNNKPELKITYVEKVDDTWWLGSGIYLSDLPANFSSTSRYRFTIFVEAAAKYARENGRDKALKAFNDKNSLFFKRGLYVFAYDFEGNTLAAPTQPDLIGKNRIDVEDPNGAKLIRDMVDLAKAGSGFTYYVYADPARNMMQRLKLSYATKIDDNWWLGAGLYTSD